MKKRINKKRVKAPAYAFGIDQAMNIGTSAGGGIGSIISSFGEEGSGADIAGGAISGAASGASIGMAAGPIGAAVGGGLGLIGGLFSGFNKRKKIREMKRRKQTAKEAQLGLNNAALNESEYWDDNTLAYSYANGGIIPNDLAYLDNDEVIRDIYGNIEQVPDNKPGTDNHLVDASDLESVLSDKIKRPGTNKTFAEEGKKLARMTKTSKGKDIFADNTNELNRRNANKKYNELLAEQEQVKAKKGIKPKSKGIPAYQNGLDGTDKWPTIWNTPYDVPFGRTSTTPQYDYINNITPAGRLPWLPYGNSESTIKSTIKPTIGVGTNKKRGTSSKNSTIPIFNKVDTPEIKVWDLEEAPMLNIDDTDPTLSPLELGSNNNSKGNRKLGNLGNLGDWLDLAPTAYNLIQGIRGPEIEDNVLNPYAGATARTMARRRMNINPAREANRRSRAIANYNAANMNANTGANLAFRTQAAVSEYANNADMYATKQNADNAYLGEYANMMNNLGQQFVQGQRLTDDANARNRAMSRTFTGTGLSQLGQWNQVRRQEKNQANRDEMIYPYLKNFLAYGNSKELIEDMDRRYYGRK